MCNSQFNLFFLIFNLLVFHFSSRTSAIRTDIGFEEKKSCRSTVQGRYLLSDDNGHVCDALSVDPESHCCPITGDKFSLDTLKQHVMKVKIAKPTTAGTYASVFDFCAGRCRHNSESVVHENAYLSDFHHCFSMPSKTSGANATQLEARLNGINVVIGRQGESCDSVCKSNGQSCVPNKLLVLNQCDVMQKYMKCKGVCMESIGADQPAVVVDTAPKHLNPGACLYTRTQSMLSCDGLHQHTRRLCPCA